MAFNWISTPQIPAQNLPQPSVPSDTSYKVDHVANTVDWGGELRYNTSNEIYDVVYEFDSLNIHSSIINVATIKDANINTFHGNTISGNNIIFDTSHIANLTVGFGITPNTPLSNDSIVNKEYVDNAVASIAGGSGFDTTANLFLEKGDLLVGISPNTAIRLPVGLDGQVLSINSSEPQQVIWKDAPRLSQDTFGLYIGTHEHPYRRATTIHLKRADAIEMETGEFIEGWSNLTANLLSIGVGGRDANSLLVANAWYEIYAIYNPTTNEKALLLHLARQRTIDQSWPGMAGENWTFSTGSRVNYLRRSDTNITAPFDRYLSKISQSFIPNMDGRLRAIDLVQTSVTASLSFEGNVWCTIQNDDGTGNATGTIFSTSRSFNLREMAQQVHPAHYVFDNPPTLWKDHRYHIVIEGDWPINTAFTTDANSVGFIGNLAPVQFPPNQQFWMPSVGYSVPKPTSQTDIALGFGDCRTYNAITQRWSVSANLASGFGTGSSDLFFRTHMYIYDTPVVLPIGFTKKALISYTCTNQNTRLKEYSQANKTMMMDYNSDWRAWSANNLFGGFPIDLANMQYVIPPTECLVRFTVKCLAESIRFTPLMGFSKFFGGVVQAPLRPMYAPDGRPQQTLMTPEVDMSDLQMLYTRNITTPSNMIYYVSSITF